jgi:hypothetical protein
VGNADDGGADAEALAREIAHARRHKGAEVAGDEGESLIARFEDQHGGEERIVRAGRVAFAVGVSAHGVAERGRDVDARDASSEVSGGERREGRNKRRDEEGESHAYIIVETKTGVCARRSGTIAVMENRVLEVPLRERATPYDFVVTMSSGGRIAGLYKGRAYKGAIRSYWQGVNTLQFLSLSGKVEIHLSLKRKPFGGFVTAMEGGQAVTVHRPDGNCKEWVTREWTGHPVEEKVISHIPGTLGLPRDPND